MIRLEPKNLKIEKKKKLNLFMISYLLIPFFSLVISDFLSENMLSTDTSNIFIIIKLLIIGIFIATTINTRNSLFLKKLPLILLAFLITIICIYFSRVQLINIPKTTKYKDLILFVLWPADIYILYYFFKSKFSDETINYLIENILIVINIVAIFSIIYMLIKDNEQIVLFQLENFTQLTNFSGYFSNRNSLGQVLYVFLSVFIIYKDFYVEKKGYLLYYIGFLLQFIAILLTMSRASLFSFFIFIFLIVVIKSYYKFSREVKIKIVKSNVRNRRITMNSFFKILIITICIMTIFYNEKIIQFIASFVRIESGLSGRLELWEKSVIAAKGHFLFGVGELGLRTLINYGSSTSYQPHNFYIDTLTSNGIIVLIIFIFYFFFLIREAFIKSKQNQGARSIAIISFILSFLFYLNFESFKFWGVGLQPSLINTVTILFVLTFKHDDFKRKDN